MYELIMMKIISGSLLVIIDQRQRLRRACPATCLAKRGRRDIGKGPCVEALSTPLAQDGYVSQKHSITGPQKGNRKRGTHKRLPSIHLKVT